MFRLNTFFKSSITLISQRILKIQFDPLSYIYINCSTLLIIIALMYVLIVICELKRHLKARDFCGIDCLFYIIHVGWKGK